MNNDISQLGLSFGRGDRRFQTRFGDVGLISPNSPLRTAYAEIEPTFLGMLAGSMRLLRDPQIVFSLSVALQESQKTMWDHLMGIYNSMLVAVYGDTGTANQLKLFLTVMHNRAFTRGQLPQWYIDTNNVSRSFNTGTERFRAAATLALTDGVARAHQLVDLVPRKDEQKYYGDLASTIGWANSAKAYFTGPGLDDLTGLARGYNSITLMDATRLQEAGVPAVLNEILNVQLAARRTVRSYAKYFVGLMYPEDREQLGLVWMRTDQQRLEQWGVRYSTRRSRPTFAVAARGND